MQSALDAVLLDAVLKNDPVGVQRAIADGADPSFQVDGGTPVLFYAVRLANLAAVRALIAGGADLESVDAKETPVLSYAAQCASSPRHERVLRLLIEAGAPLEQLDGFRSTALEQAIHYRNPGAARVLLDAGAAVRPRIAQHPAYSELVRGATARAR